MSFSFLRLSVLLLYVSVLLSIAHAQLLSRFSSCPKLLNYYRSNAVKRVGPYGLGFINRRRPFSFLQPFSSTAATASAAKSLPVAGVDFSETNVQVQGVDEPDIIKTDGKTMFILRGKTLFVVAVTRDGAAGKETGKLKLPGYAREIIVEGDHILAISQSYSKRKPSTLIPNSGSFQPYYLSTTVTIVYQIKVVAGVPKLLATLEMEGLYISSREVKGVARIVMSYDPARKFRLINPAGNLNTQATTKRNKDLMRKSRLEDWLPSYELELASGSVSRGFVTSCNQVYYPTQFSGFKLLSVVTVSVSGVMKPGVSVSIIADGNNIYSTASTLYVATNRYRIDLSGRLAGASYTTFFHKFRLLASSATYEASGQVTGRLLNQFSMHEYKDTFFVATTLGASWWSNSDLSVSKVTSFETRKTPWVRGRFRRGARLVKVGEVGNLGVGERIFAVRYVAAKAYVVTFRQIDPLYVIDLSNKRNLKVRGELKIPGFSTYLHPISGGRLIGVGREATLEGRTVGAKVSLFDVSDVTKPKELSSWTLKGSYSRASWDHRAFLYWAPKQIAVLPLSVYSQNSKESYTGSIVLKVSDTKIYELGRITHESTKRQRGIERNLVLGRTHLWSLSQQKLQVNNIDTLAAESSVKLIE